jgi:hypothetical protein
MLCQPWSTGSSLSGGYTYQPCRYFRMVNSILYRSLLALLVSLWISRFLRIGFT